jgi:hypothetical protein
MENFSVKAQLIFLLVFIEAFGLSCSKSKGGSDTESEKAPLIRASLGDGPDVDAAKGLLRSAFVQGRNKSLDEVKVGLQLVQQGPNGVKIEWSSSNLDFINPSTGAVKRPPLGSEDVKVRVTAALTKGTARDSKSFQVTLKSYKLEELRFEPLYHGTNQATEFPSSSGLRATATGSQILIGTYIGLAKSSDGGNTWSSRTVQDNLASNTVNVLAASGNTLIAGDNYLGVSVSFDGGVTFKRIVSSQFNGYQISDAFIDGTNLYVMTYLKVFKSTDAALSWSEVSTVGATGDGFQRIHVSGSALLLGRPTGLSISTNAGASWSNLNDTSNIGSSSNSSVVGIAKLGANYYLATSGGLSVSSNSGASWTLKTSGLLSPDLSSVCVNSTGVYVSYGYGTDGISRSTNGGTAWTSYNTGSAATGVLDLACTDSLIYGVGLSRVVSAAVSTNSFVTVSPTSRFTQGVALAVNSTQVYANSGLVTYVASHENKTFAPVTFPGGNYWLGATDVNLYFGTYGGGLYKSGNQGVSATRITGALPAGNVVAGKISDSTVLVGTGSAGLGVSVDLGTTFSTLTTSQGLASNQVNDIEIQNGVWYLATGNGFNVSSNKGASWQTRNTSHGLPDVDVRCVAALGASLFAGTYYGLSVSTNGGSSFESIGSENGYVSNYVNKCITYEKSLYLATEGGVAISVDGGRRFQNFSTRNGLTVEAVRALAVQGGNIYAMTAEGLVKSSWKDEN